MSEKLEATTNIRKSEMIDSFRDFLLNKKGVLETQIKMYSIDDYGDRAQFDIEGLSQSTLNVYRAEWENSGK